MLSALLNDVRIYLRLVWIQMRSQAQYKINLAIDIGTSFAVTALEFSALFLYFGAFPSLLGWKVGEVALLYALMAIGFGFSEMVGAGIEGFAEIIRRGEFDRVLLRPAGALTQIIGSDFRLRRTGRITQGIMALVIALRLLPGLHWSLLKLLVLFIGIASGAAMFMAVLLLGATMCFWTIETTELTNILTYGGREMMSYPLIIYHPALQGFFLFVVPLAFGAYVPTCYLLGRALPFGLPAGIAFTAPLIALVFALVAGAIWRFGVRRYQSTGS